MNEKALARYYNFFKNLRVTQDATADIDFINSELIGFERESAVLVCSELALKYELCINRIGNLISGLTVIKDMALYKQKTDKDIFTDLEYVRNCIVVYATVKSGLEPDYLTCIRKISH